jgi:AcrR family transcriptional regulator
MKSKRDKIIDAAIKLFAVDGVAVATAVIAKEAGVSNGSLFNYFSSKQLLIDEVYLEIKTEVADQILSDISKIKVLKNFLFRLWNSYILWAIANPVKYNVVHLLRASKAVSAGAITRTEEIFQVANQKINQGIIDGKIVNIPLDYYCDLVSSQLMAAVSYAKAQKLKGKNLEKFIQTSFDIYWNGITKK